MMAWLRAGLASVLAGASALGALWLAGEAGFENARHAVAPGSVLAREGRAILYHAPVPDWLPALRDGEAQASQYTPGVSVTFWEQHALLTGPRPVVTTRYRVAADTRAGADAVALSHHGFSPSQQQLVLHEALVRRNGEWMDVTHDVAVTFSQTGLDLASRVQSDQTVALMRLPGVRRGDMVQLSVSVIGNHRLGDRFNASAFLEGNPLGAGRLRLTALGEPGALVSSHGRPVRRERVEPDLERLIIYDGPTPGWRMESYRAPWRLQDGSALISRTPSYEPLARWTGGLYRPEITPEITAIAATIAEAHPDRAGRITAALRYVQREIRYFALSLGDAGYVPQGVTETLRLSEGDCKAKTLLLISILAALEVEAVPVLVNGQLGPGLDTLPRSILLFDHVIAGVEHEGEWFWLDPARLEQPGALTALGQHHYGWGVVGRPGETDLTWLSQPDGGISQLHVAERFELEADGSAAFSTAWTFGGLWAEGARDMIDESGREAFARHISGVYRGRLAATDFAPEVRVTDRRAANQIVFETSGPVRLHDVRARDDSEDEGEGEGEAGSRAPVLVITPHAALDPAALVDTRERAAPVLMPDSRHVRHTIEVRLPEGWAAPEPFEQAVSNPGFDGAVSLEAIEGGFILTKEYRITAGELALDALGAVVGDLKQTRRAALIWLPDGERPDVAVNPAVFNAVLDPSVPPAANPAAAMSGAQQMSAPG